MPVSHRDSFSVLDAIVWISLSCPTSLADASDGGADFGVAAVATAGTRAPDVPLALPECAAAEPLSDLADPEARSNAGLRGARGIRCSPV